MVLRNTSLIVPAILLTAGCASRVHEVHLEAAVSGDAPAAIESVDVGQATAPAANRLSPGPTLSLVFLPPADESLPVREAPSFDALAVDALDRYTIDVPSTGRSEMVHSMRWVEVITPNEGAGWIPASYTTEWIPSEDFCDAPDVSGDLLDELTAALEEGSADRLESVLSPEHGVRVRYLRTDEPLHFTNVWAATAMAEGQPIAWGVDPATGEMVRGSFSELVGDELGDVLTWGEVTCNRLMTGAAPYLPEIPSGEENLNFVSVHLPAADDLGMDWVTWTVGFTFDDGRATIATLNRYAWEG